MTAIGFFLLICGFLLGAYSTALDVQITSWKLFVPAAIVAIAGVVMIKRQSRGASRSKTLLTANRTELEESLSNIVRELEQIELDSQGTSTRRLRQSIDEKLRDDLRRFADARESMVHLYGLQAYADIMSEFAAGERYVNRVWSAAADGYEAEAWTYIQKAQAQFRSAARRLQSADRSATAA